MRSHLDKIQALVTRQLESIPKGHDAPLLSLFVNQAHLTGADPMVYP